MSRMFYPRTSVLILIISSTVRLVNILQFTVFDQTNNFVWKLSGKLMVKTKFKIPNFTSEPEGQVPEARGIQDHATWGPPFVLTILVDFRLLKVFSSLSQ